MRLSYVKIIFFLSLVLSVHAEPDSKIDYHFEGKISRPVLENYLARSSTFGSLLHLTLDDDLRMIKNTGVKFAGRAVWMWGGESKIDELVRVNLLLKGFTKLIRILFFREPFLKW